MGGCEDGIRLHTVCIKKKYQHISPLLSSPLLSPPLPSSPLLSSPLPSSPLSSSPSPFWSSSLVYCAALFTLPSYTEEDRHTLLIHKTFHLSCTPFSHSTAKNHLPSSSPQAYLILGVGQVVVHLTQVYLRAFPSLVKLFQSFLHPCSCMMPV